MHQREASSYGRRFLYGKRLPVAVVDLTRPEFGIGLIPAEFDDLKGCESEVIEDFRVSRSPEP